MVCFIWEDTQRLFIFTGNLAHDLRIRRFGVIYLLRRRFLRSELTMITIGL